MRRKALPDSHSSRGESGINILIRLATGRAQPVRMNIVLWVFRDYDAHWCVRREGGDATETFASRDAALDHARALGRRCGSYRLYFQLRDGRIAEELFNLCSP